MFGRRFADTVISILVSQIMYPTLHGALLYLLLNMYRQTATSSLHLESAPPPSPTCLLGYGFRLIHLAVL